MREIAAHSLARDQDVLRGADRGAGAVAERDLSVHPVADRLHTLPSRRNIAEELPRSRCELVGHAQPARQRERERVVRELRRGKFLRVRRDRVRLARELHQRRVPQGGLALGHRHPTTEVAEAVDVTAGRDERVDVPVLVDHARLRVEARLDLEHGMHRGLRALHELAPDLDSHQASLDQARITALSPR